MIICHRCGKQVAFFRDHWVRWGPRHLRGEARLCDPCYELALLVSVLARFDLEELC